MSGSVVLPCEGAGLLSPLTVGAGHLLTASWAARGWAGRAGAAGADGGDGGDGGEGPSLGALRLHFHTTGLQTLRRGDTEGIGDAVTAVVGERVEGVRAVTGTDQGTVLSLGQTGQGRGWGHSGLADGAAPPHSLLPGGQTAGLGQSQQVETVSQAGHWLRSRHV